MVQTPFKSIRRKLRLTVLGLLGTLSVTCAVVHELHARRDARRSHEAAAGLLADALLTGLRSHDAEELQRRFRSMVHHPAVLAAGVWDKSGELAASAERAEGLVTAIGPPSSPRNTGLREVLLPYRIHGASTALRFDRILQGVTASESPLTIAFLFSPARLAPHAAWAWSFYLPIICVTIVLGWIARAFLTKNVCAPLDALANVLSAEPNEEHEEYLTQREDGWSEIATQVRSLGDELNDSREKVRLLERRMRTQIAEETRRITRDLEQAQRESWLDPLTRLKNRRMLADRLPALFDAQKQHGEDLSVVLFDLDHFKELNDTLGHRAGDEILVFAGELLRQCSRSDDLAIRYGGDELLLVLPGISATHALSLAKRIMALFTQRAKVMFEGVRPPSMTAGVASLHQNRPKNHLDLIHQADKALYAAKRLRRRHDRHYHTPGSRAPVAPAPAAGPVTRPIASTSPAAAL